jgi:hypothetical protein
MVRILQTRAKFGIKKYSPILVGEHFLCVRIGGEIDGRKGDVAQQTGARTFVQSEQAQLLDHGPGADFLAAGDFTGHL